MNKKRRNVLSEAESFLQLAEAKINFVFDQESDVLDNFPENLQGSDRYANTEEAVELLEEAVDKVSEVRENLAYIIGLRM